MKRKRKTFEIKFYERLLTRRPNFKEVLSCLGGVYTRKGFYSEGLDMDRRLVKLMPQDPVVRYNLACSLSLVDDIDAAFRELKKAVLLGYDDFFYILKDPDLVNLREDKRFRDFFCRMRKVEEIKQSACA